MAYHAKVGGEIGANGAHYKGGQFVNTIPENDKRDAAASRKRAAYMKRRQQVSVAADSGACSGFIAVYELPPSETARALFGQLAGVCPLDRAANTFGKVPEQYRAYVGESHAATLDALREAYNRGARWFG